MPLIHIILFLQTVIYYTVISTQVISKSSLTLFLHHFDIAKVDSIAVENEFLFFSHTDQDVLFQSMLKTSTNTRDEKLAI